MLRNTTLKSLISLALILILGLPVLAKDKAPAKTTEKPKIAVLALEAKNIPAVYADIVRDILEVNLHKQGNFAVLERSQINLIMKEQKATLNQCSETQCAVDYGKVLSADLVVVGSISRLTEYNISVKLVDISEGRIIAAEFEQVPSDKELDRAVNNLAGRISRAAMKDTGYVPEPQDDDRHPMYFGIAYRYGLWEIPLPVLKLPETPGDPIVIDKIDVLHDMMSVIASTTYDINTFLALKTNANATVWSSQIRKSQHETLDITSDEYHSLSTTVKSGRFKGIGIDGLLQFNYPVLKLTPYAAIGGGYYFYRYNYSNQSYIYANNTSTHYSDFSDGNLNISNNIHLFMLALETGINYMLIGPVGLNLSFICNYPVKQSIIKKISYETRYYNNTNGYMPANYPAPGAPNLKKADSFNSTPIFSIQVGIVYRFM